jgi:predicted  nucleic acid-binding Zn-ribbon protein
VAQSDSHRSLECDIDRRQFENFRAEIHEWKQELEACRTNGAKLREEMTEMRNEIAQMQTANSTVTERAHKAETALEEMSALRIEVEQLRAANTQIAQRAHDAETALKECQSHGSKLKEQLAQAGKQRDEYMSTKLSQVSEPNLAHQSEMAGNSAQNLSAGLFSGGVSRHEALPSNHLPKDQSWARQRNGFWISRSHSSWTESASGSFQSVGGYWFQDSRGGWIYVTQSDIYRNSRDTAIQTVHGYWTRQEQGHWVEHSIGYWFRSNNGSWVETTESGAQSVKAGLGQALGQTADNFLIVDSENATDECITSRSHADKASGADVESSMQTNVGQGKPSLDQPGQNDLRQIDEEHDDLGQSSQEQKLRSRDTHVQTTRDQHHFEHHDAYNSLGRVDKTDSKRDELRSGIPQAGTLAGGLLGVGVDSLVGVACHHSRQGDRNQGSSDELQFGQGGLSHSQSGQALSAEQSSTQGITHTAQLATPPPETQPPSKTQPPGQKQDNQETFGQGPFGPVPLDQGPFNQKPIEHVPLCPPPLGPSNPEPLEQASVQDPNPPQPYHDDPPKLEENHEIGFLQRTSDDRKSNQNETEKTSFSGAATQTGRSDNEDSCERLRKEIDKVRIHLKKVQSHLTALEEEFKRTCGCRKQGAGGMINGHLGVTGPADSGYQGGDVQSLLSGILGG